MVGGSQPNCLSLPLVVVVVMFVNFADYNDDKVCFFHDFPDRNNVISFFFFLYKFSHFQVVFVANGFFFVVFHWHNIDNMAIMTFIIDANRVKLRIFRLRDIMIILVYC